MFRKMAVSVALVGASVGLGAQVRPAITGVSFVRNYAADPAASAAFYGGVLGFERAVEGDVQRFTVNDLQTVEVLPLPSPAPVSRQAAVGLTTRDVRGMQRYLRAHGVAIVQPLAHGRFGVNDPEGNLIFFVQSAPRAHAADLSPRAPSHRIIHAGFIVHDEAVENAFYKDILGFQPYWRGSREDNGPTTYVSQHVPEGTDWIEFMLGNGPNLTQKQLGGSDHFALGVAKIDDAVAGVTQNGCVGAVCSNAKRGRDGKMQLNLFDPDRTRVEFMEYTASGTTCCSPILGKAPGAVEDR